MKITKLASINVFSILSKILHFIVKVIVSFCHEIFFIWFILDAIRHHILQWASEKNRKISDGYDFEVLNFFHTLQLYACC